MNDLKSDILLYIDDAASSDDDLVFLEHFLPDELTRRIGTLENAGSVFFSVPSSYKGTLSGNASCFPRTGHDDVEFWKNLFARTGSAHLCKLYAESPFLDVSIIKEMIDLHLNYLAEFTYSENLPPGFSAEIVSQELIAAIPDVHEKTLPLSQVIKSNLNHFDIEIYYKDPDVRDNRISFLSSRTRDARIMEHIHRTGSAIPAYRDVKGIIENHPEVLYRGPSYLEIELTGRCDLECIFCYRNFLKKHHGDMNKDLVSLILEQMKSFSLPYTICFGGSGEPMMHANFYEILTIAAKDPLVEAIIIETNGLYADANYRTHLTNAGDKIRTIININGVNQETYTALHGKDYFDRVYNNVKELSEAAVGRLYLQIMKIKETESYLDGYYDFWEKLKVPIILQKQNIFLGRIADRRYSDLSPLVRVPCWHLQRDLYVTANGTVTFCKQDVDGDCVQYPLAALTLSDIWEKKKQDFINDYRKQYPAAPDCASCDEWYTFNA